MTHVNPALEQVHFRGREDDVALNSASFTRDLDADWTQPVDVAFRLRFEVQEIAGASIGVTPQLEYSRNGGAFVDVEREDFYVRPSNSDHYTQLASTTNVLEGSGRGFVAGWGDDLNADPGVGITLNNQHTEVEFCLVLDGREVSNGDKFAFRVSNGGEALNSYAVTPTVTASRPAPPAAPESATALPSTARAPMRHWQGGPFKSSGGAYYVVALSRMNQDAAGTGQLVQVFKAADPNESWSLAASWDTGRIDDECASLSVAQDGDVLYVWPQDNGGDAAYNRFSMAEDKWLGADTAMSTFDSGYPNLGRVQCNLVRRSTGEMIVVHQGISVSETGTDQVQYIRKAAGGAWTITPVTVQTGSTSPLAVLGASNLIHIFYRLTSDGHLYHRTLSTSNVLSSAQAVSDTETEARRPALQAAVYYDASGTERVTVAWKRASDGKVCTSVIEDAGTPSVEVTASDLAVPSVDHQPVGRLVKDGTTVHLLYADPDADLRRDQNADNGGWGTDKEERDEAQIRRMTANLLDAGKIAVVYEHGWALYYDEIALGGGGEGEAEGTALVSGGGSIEATGQSERDDVAGVTGGGAIQASGTTKSSAQTATVTGSGFIAALGSTQRSGTSAVGGGGALSTQGAKAAAGTAAISGGGEVSAVGAEGNAGSAAVSGGGEISASGVKDAQGSAAVNGGGTTASAGTKSASGGAQVSGGGVVTAQGSAEESHSGSASVSGGGGLDTSGRKGAEGSASVSAGGAAQASGAKHATGQAEVVGGGTVSAEGSSQEVRFGSAAVSAGGSVDALGRKGALSASAIPGGGAITVAGESGRGGALTISGGGQLAVLGSSARLGTATVVGGGLVIASGLAPNLVLPTQVELSAVPFTSVALDAERATTVDLAATPATRVVLRALVGTDVSLSAITQTALDLEAQ